MIEVQQFSNHVSFYLKIATAHLSRVLPARSWAGAVPTVLTYESLDNLCRPGQHPQKEIPGPELSPLERFLGCVSMRRHLQTFIREEGVSFLRRSRILRVLIQKLIEIDIMFFLDDPNTGHRAWCCIVQS